ncbi:MAG: hypothetical protein A2X29_09135 [Elusimicrobia bacterium GWA2_64_40]|nr:MAG: hypothetical protein A2X29_09135 [Elusimicrobia bacterium GWA2_64_40]OGR62876.1 MAG: hypothetical protein A2X30_07130 [Elusimicrobia bacterium GWB2_63_16]HAN05753.1 hypothetical protein [Elusimicrobiota bacterium]
MRTKNILITLLLLALPLCAAAGEFKDKGETIAVDFPAGWAAGKSDDPTVTLKLEKGKNSFEFSKQDSELGDYYLKARVKEQVDSLRSKGTSLAGDVRPVGLHGVSTAYYTSYEAMGAEAYIAFFTYNSASYAVSARGLSDGEFRAVLASVRKPGEVIVQPKPKKIRVVRRKKEPEEDSSAQIFKDGAADVSTAAVAASTESVLNAFAQSSTETVPAVQASTQPALAEAAGAAAQNFLEELSKKQEGDTGKPPYLPREPLSIIFWGSLIGLWVAGSFAARSMAAAYQNPKLPPPPADVPPDFFFPFVISKNSTMKDVTYQVVTRQKQRLMAEFVSEHDVYIAGAVYGCVLFHVGWSLLAAVGYGAAVTNSLLMVPLLGRALASLPEAVFAVPLLVGLSIYFTKKNPLQLFDAQNSLVLEVRPEITYGLIRDGNGKEIARLVAKGTFLYRYWEFVDTDNLVVFAIRDDFPRGYLLRKLFGSLGGALRSRYGIFAQDRRAGFVFLDPSSADRFQIHMDYAFARLGHPAHILAAVLYVISREKDPGYPSPF